MTHYDDDLERASEHRPVDDLADLDGQSASVAAFLTDLRALGQDEAPAPSTQLAVWFAAARPLDIARRRRAESARRIGLAAAAAAIATVGLTGVAAANDQLPQPAQRVVSRLLNDFTPFHIEPADAPAIGPVEQRRRDEPKPAVPVAPKPPAQPNETSPEPAKPQAPEPGNSPTTEPDDESGGGTSGSGEEDRHASTDGANTDPGVADGGGDDPSDANTEPIDGDPLVTSGGSHGRH